jgi:putative FmdB family regulatory protein
MSTRGEIMPIYDYWCKTCDAVFEWTAKYDEVVKCPLCFDEDAEKIFPTKAPSFKLTYNPKTDMVDWDGNRTQYYDAYKKMKAEGKKPRIPELDGESRTKKHPLQE